MAATESRRGERWNAPRVSRREIARCSATYAPVMEAVRVPPSASSTSQSTQSVRSPRPPSSATARRLRPIRRWISWVRPEGRPRVASRSLRRSVEPGSIEYSAVIQPFPLPCRKRGTLGSSVTVQSTFVRPISQSTELSGFAVKSRTNRTGRSASGLRPSARPHPTCACVTVVSPTRGAPTPCTASALSRHAVPRVVAPTELVYGAGERVGDLLLSHLAPEGPLLLGIGDESNLDQGGGHLDPHQHIEGGLLDATRGVAVDRRELLVCETCELVRFDEVLAHGEVPEDRCDRIASTGRSARGAEGRVLTGCDTLGGLVAGMERHEEGLDAACLWTRCGIRVDGEEELAARLIGHGRSLLETYGVVRVACHHHLKAVVTQARCEAARHIEHDVLFEEAVRSTGSLIVATVPGVDHDP